MERMDKRDYYMNIARAVSLRSTCLRRQYGAVIVKNDEIIATGYNGAPRGDSNCIEKESCVREAMNIPQGERYELCCAVHAEQNAIISASRSSMIGSTLYLYGRDSKSGKTIDAVPCALCRRMIQNAGIKLVICGKADDHGDEFIFIN